jgi:hypothetical protein
VQLGQQRLGDALTGGWAGPHQGLERVLAKGQLVLGRKGVGVGLERKGLGVGRVGDPAEQLLRGGFGWVLGHQARQRGRCRPPQDPIRSRQQLRQPWGVAPLAGGTGEQADGHDHGGLGVPACGMVQPGAQARQAGRCKRWEPGQQVGRFPPQPVVILVQQGSSAGRAACTAW